MMPAISPKTAQVAAVPITPVPFRAPNTAPNNAPPIIHLDIYIHSFLLKFFPAIDE